MTSLIDGGTADLDIPGQYMKRSGKRERVIHSIIMRLLALWQGRRKASSFMPLFQSYLDFFFQSEGIRRYSGADSKFIQHLTKVNAEEEKGKEKEKGKDVQNDARDCTACSRTSSRYLYDWQLESAQDMGEQTTTNRTFDWGGPGPPLQQPPQQPYRHLGLHIPGGCYQAVCVSNRWGTVSATYCTWWISWFKEEGENLSIASRIHLLLSIGIARKASSTWPYANWQGNMMGRTMDSSSVAPHPPSAVIYFNDPSRFCAQKGRSRYIFQFWCHRTAFTCM